MTVVGLRSLSGRTRGGRVPLIMCVTLCNSLIDPHAFVAVPRQVTRLRDAAA